MSDTEHEKWEQWYLEAAQRDFEREIYRHIDAEDAEELS